MTPLSKSQGSVLRVASMLASPTCPALHEMSRRMKEYHHFYPVLFYFRFAESYYSNSKSSRMLLDTVSLLKSALDD
jgi:hypothetical protein